MTTSEPLDDSTVEELDRRYHPFPDFAEWSSLSVNARLWDEAASLLVTARSTTSETDIDTAREMVLRAAAITTGAIEGLYTADRGFTITVAEQATSWRQGIEERGPKTLDLFQAQLEAYQFALDAATGRTPISEAWIRNLHEVATAPQETYKVYTSMGPQEQPLPRGMYKRHPNHVALPDGTVHVYAPVEETPREMNRLVEVIRTPEFDSAHPALQASYVHYALTLIHPFADGNGRVARSLGSVWLFRALSLPLVIFTEQAEEYLKSLADADQGNYAGFVDFIIERTIDSVMLAQEMLQRARIKPPENSVRSLRDMLVYQGEATHAQMDEFAISLIRSLISELNNVASELELPDSVSFSADAQNSNEVMPDLKGFRPLARMPRQKIVATFNSQPPATAATDRTVWPYVSVDRMDNFPLALALHAGPILMRFRLSEVRHGITQAAQYRIRSLAEQLIGEMLPQLEAAARNSLNSAGYTFET